MGGPHGENQMKRRRADRVEQSPKAHTGAVKHDATHTTVTTKKHRKKPKKRQRKIAYQAAAQMLSPSWLFVRPRPSKLSGGLPSLGKRR